MSSQTYLVLGCKSWNREVFQRTLRHFPGNWYYIGSPEELSEESITSYHPRYLFFLNWSWKVVDPIVRQFECVCFHPTDLPYGRGGSPFQNLILRGYRETKLTAFQMTSEMDAGPIYMKEPLSLEGTCEEMFIRFNALAAGMIRKIISIEPKPTPQAGEVVTFKRRRPEESRINPHQPLEKLYDFIRMLDGEGYPRAFYELDGMRYEFGQASLRDGVLTADVVLKRPSETHP